MATHNPSPCRGARWRPSLRLIVVVLTWGIATTAALGAMLVYETRPGAAKVAPASWPMASTIPHRPGVHHLVMFAHPKCPCTRASVGELAQIMAHAPDVQADVVFLHPEGMEVTWVESGLWRSAGDIPGVRCKADRRGVEAQRFGAATSGFTVLYDEDGRLVFCGGITGTRGHFGDNAGRSRVVALLNGLDVPADGAATCVFGCPLFEREVE